MNSAYGFDAVFWLLRFVGVIFLPVLPVASQEAPLSQRIDSVLSGIPRMFEGGTAPPEALLRRLSLDVRGVVPLREELDAFMADGESDRWSRWVRRFLEDPLCDEHLVQMLDRSVMLRRPYVQVDRAAWLQFLRDQVANDVPLDHFCRQLLFAPWWNRDHRASQRFYLDRAGDPHLITRDIGRVFLGRDLQCAQCHDHPQVEDYRQIDYHGLLAFVSGGGFKEISYKDTEGKDQKVVLYEEAAAGDPPFESVFDKGVAFRSGPRLPEACEQFQEYLRPDARLVDERPADALPGVSSPPKASRRELIARQLASRDYRVFVENWANRLWSMMFGRGVVQPLDMHHPNNPSFDSELLKLISDGLVALDLRPRPFLEQLALTKAYQSAAWSSPPDALRTAESLKHQREIWTARHVAMEAEIATSEQTDAHALAKYEEATEAWRKVQADRAAVRTELDASEAAMMAEKQKHDAAQAASAVAAKKYADAQQQIALLTEAAQKIQQATALLSTEDSELKQSVAVLAQRAEALKSKLPELEKGAIDTKAAAEASLVLLKTATEKVDQVVTRLQPVQQSLAIADDVMTRQRAVWSQARRVVAKQKMMMEHSDRILAWLDGQEHLGTLLSKQAAAEGTITAIKDEISKLTTEMTNLKQTTATATARQANAVAELASAKQLLSQHQSELETFNSAEESLVALSKLFTNAAVDSALEALRQEVQNRRSINDQRQTTVDAAAEQVHQASTELAKLQESLEELSRSRGELEARLAAGNEVLSQCREAILLHEQAMSDKWNAIGESHVRFAAAAMVRPLTPEQLCWSILRITGQLEAYIQTEMTELAKESPLAADADPPTVAKRRQQAVRRAFDKLRGIADLFVSLYGSGANRTEDDFFASADQALFASNAGSIFAWAGPAHNNPTQQAIAAPEPQQVAHCLYWGFQGRKPTEGEVALVEQQIRAAGDQRNAVIQEMAWGILAGAEFRFRH